jgi:acetyl esterase/lipase
MPTATWQIGWVFLLTVSLAGAVAQDSGSNEDERPPITALAVWPKDAPGSETWTQREVEHHSALLGTTIVRNVVRPTLTAFLPERSKANGTAVIICPGGGFAFLAKDEGIEEAKSLRARGAAVFVLKHRLMDTGETEAEFHKSLLKAALLKAVEDGLKPKEDRPVLPEDVRKFSALAVADGRQAIKVVREHASEWGIKLDRVGIMGFSSGGLVTTGVATEYDSASRPNYAASLYGPVLGSVTVPEDAPPLFICCASDDPLVPPGNSVRLYSAWNAAGKSAELHIYAKGGHGFGGQGLPSDAWLDRFGDWLGQQGLFKPMNDGK